MSSFLTSSQEGTEESHLLLSEERTDEKGKLLVLLPATI